MADLKSSEGKLTTLECMECGFREVFTERQFQTTDGYRCYVCDGLVKPSITRPNEPIRNRRMKEKGSKSLYRSDRVQLSNSKKLGEISVKVDMDVSDALKGLKAVQREVRKTIKLLKEVETLSKSRR